MSLVTRCPACTTTFKVVRDQLRISDGWVRCGRCSEVFDATLDLMDTESGVPVPPHSFVSPKPPPLDDARSSVPPEPSPAPMGDGDRGATPAAHPFEALPSDLRSFGQQEPVGPVAVPPPAALPMSWPAAGLLELPAAAPTPAPTPAAPAPAASSAPLAVPEPSTARVALRPEGEAAPAPAVPAWRRIQVAPAPPPAVSQEVEGVVADEPWPMRRASAPQDAAPPPASTSAIDAAVDAQLQKALRRARVQALREERERQAPTGGGLARERDDTAGEEPASPSASVLRQASTDGAGVDKAAEVDEAPSTDTLLDSTLYSAEFLVSQPAVLEAPARRRGRAWWFGLLALLAGVLLVAQVLRHDRNAWAASQPALRPAIEALCELTACVVSAPRRIDAVRIDGSSFTPSRQGERYELMFTLRNAAPTAVAMPSIELSLLDGNERPVMRRVFHPADFGAPAQMGPRAEQMAQLHLSVQVPPEQRAPSVMGYSMLAFYP